MILGRVLELGCVDYGMIRILIERWDWRRVPCKVHDVSRLRRFGRYDDEDSEEQEDIVQPLNMEMRNHNDFSEVDGLELQVCRLMLKLRGRDFAKWNHGNVCS
jgi:hypothetical protein